MDTLTLLGVESKNNNMLIYCYKEHGGHIEYRASEFDGAQMIYITNFSYFKILTSSKNPWATLLVTALNLLARQAKMSAEQSARRNETAIGSSRRGEGDCYMMGQRGVKVVRGGVLRVQRRDVRKGFRGGR